MCRAPVVVNQARGMAGAEGAPKYGAAKSFKEAWLSDKGVSPLLGVQFINITITY